MKTILLSAVLLVGLQSNGRAIQLIHPPRSGVQYEPLTFRFDENLHFKNPFDLITNRVELLIRQPDFSQLVLSFFYEGLNKDSVEIWEARFTPKEFGTYWFVVRINGDTVSHFDLPVKSNTKKMQGAIKLSGRLGNFEYDSKEAFRGIGLNVCWASDYEYYFKKMHDVGINVTRIWLCPWNLPFEWTETGIGRYDLNSARRLDRILELAKKYKIYVILCIDYHGIAPEEIGYFKEDEWLVNPYNEINGGPCSNEASLFTNYVAREYFKKKYKYIVSRYGYSNNILAWELINEGDLMAGTSPAENRWLTEMAEYIKSVDVHHHLVSSSSTRMYVEKVVDAFKSSAFDFAMFHDYNILDIAPHIKDLINATTEYYRKPVVIGEFGVEFRGGDRTYRLDPHAIGLHNGIWAGLFSETPVIPMSWWWDSYIDKYDLWKEYASLSRFADSISFNAKHLVFKTLKAGNLDTLPAQQAPCLVRCIYDGPDCALWLKNIDYVWSQIAEGQMPKATGSFTQIVPELLPGRYMVIWYDPESGNFFQKTSEAIVRENGILKLTVPSLSKDLACLIKRLL